METATQETTTTELKQLSISDENISQADYERLRAGEKVEVEVEKSEPAVEKTASENEDDDSETSQEGGDEDESDSDESELLAKDKDGSKKPKRGFKKRIDKLNAKLAEAENQAEYWRQQALDIKKPEEKPKVVEAKSEGRPDEDDFETHADYVEALADWKVEQRLTKERLKQKEDEMKAEYKKAVDSHVSRLEEFKAKHDDFEDVISDVDDVMMSVTVQEIILRSENGPELMYELAKNKDEFQRICTLNAIDAARELGRLEARIQKPHEEKKVKTTTTKAPPPARPISASSANGKKSIYDDGISQAEYERMREEQEKRRRA